MSSIWINLIFNLWEIHTISNDKDSKRSLSRCFQSHIFATSRVKRQISLAECNSANVTLPYTLPSFKVKFNKEGDFDMIYASSIDKHNCKELQLFLKSSYLFLIVDQDYCKVNWHGLKWKHFFQCQEIEFKANK